MHVSDYLNIDDLPAACIEDCSGAGPVDDAVSYWVDKLSLTVDRRAGARCLEYNGYGDAIADMSDEDVAERILWLACGNFAEFRHYVARGYAPEDVPAGSDIFALG